MNGNDMTQVLTTLELTRIQKSIAKLRIKLDKVNGQIQESGRSSKKANGLIEAKNVLEAALEKSLIKEKKIMSQIAPSNNPITADVTPEPCVTTGHFLVGHLIPLDGVEWRVEKVVYKAYRLGKDGKPTKQVRYIDV